MSETPKSPPADPIIPIGLATKLGTAFAVLAAVAAALAGLFEGDQTPETITLILAALGAAYKVLDGRYNQATAAVAAKPTMVEDDEEALLEDDELSPEEMAELENLATSGHPEGPDYDPDEHAIPEGGVGGKPQI